ncbi:MAG: ABC transporter substrate-binding protein [Granulosicoccaceae bacterium]
MLNVRLSKTLVAATLVLACSTVQAESWDETVKEAKGQTVYFNAWGGSDTINSYIQWAGEQVKQTYGVTIEHVKITDAAAVVARILAEKTAERSDDGSVDLMWVNGENFRNLKTNGLLQSPWTHNLPSYALVDTDNKPTTTSDFGEPVDNLEAPWGMAQLVFMHDTATLPEPPQSMQALSMHAKANPGRVSYPKPPNFHGTTFIKQALLELTEDPKELQKPADQTDSATVTAPLWDFLDALHPTLWREGKNFPADGQQMRQLLDDGELDIALSFNPSEASRAIADGQLADTVRTYIHNSGTIGNTHFVAVPFNAKAKEGAMVFANFLMSASAQLHKADPNVWGDPTVLAMDKLDADQRSAFENAPRGVATLSPAELSPTLLEPHASWVELLESEWLKRYGH